MIVRITSIIHFLSFLLITTPGYGQEADQFGIEFSTQEQAYIDLLRENGGLKVALNTSPGVYIRNTDGSEEGFHYLVLVAFSDYIDVPLITREVIFGNFFLKDGVLPEGYRSDPTIVYTPDIFAELDLLISGITINDWRQKLMTIVPLFPVKILLITRKGEEIQQLTDLTGKTIATVETLNYYDAFQQIDAEYDLGLSYIFFEDSDLVFDAVSQGKAFATARDSDMTLLNISRYEKLNISQPLTDIQFIGWGVNKNNILLASILEKYIEYAKKEGVFSEIWRIEYGIEFNDYLRILEF